MNLFQIITLPLVGFFFVRAMVKFFRGGQSRGFVLAGAVIWLLAGVAILQPELTARVAEMLGIGRGADLVLYLFVITYLLSIWYVYGKFRKIESDMTEIVRQLAIRDAISPCPHGGIEHKEEQLIDGER